MSGTLWESHSYLVESIVNGGVIETMPSWRKISAFSQVMGPFEEKILYNELRIPN